MPPTDPELMQAMAAGSRDAFLAVYDKYAPCALGALLKVIRDRSEAEDVLQEVMVEVWRKAGRYNPALGPVGAWIIMIARSRAIDALRKRTKPGGATSASLTEDAPGPSDEHRDGAVVAESTESLDRLRSALAVLPTDQQAVVRLAYVQGLTGDQISRALGIPLGTVKTRIRLGVRRLAETARTAGEAAS